MGPGSAFLIFLECKSVIPVACEAMCSVSGRGAAFFTLLRRAFSRRCVASSGHAAPQSRDPWRRGVHNGPRISSAPRREVRRAAQHPGNACARARPEPALSQPTSRHLA
jgi:hypothetical protein